MWYWKNAARFHAEQDAVGALEADVDWLRVDGWRIEASSHLCADAEIDISGRLFPVTLRYSLNFPFTPPSVQPREPERWSDHQYGRGELCLEYGPDNWHQELTGAEMLRSAERLLRLQKGQKTPEESVPSRHSVTVGQDLRQGFARLVVTQALFEFLRDAPVGVTMRVKFRAMLRDKSYTIVPTEAQLPDCEPWIDASVPRALKRFSYEWAGLGLVLPQTVNLPDFNTGDEVRAHLANAGFVSPDGYAPEDIEFVLTGTAGQPILYWLGKDDTAFRCSTIMPSGGQRLDTDHLVLAQKRIGIVGCGSVGSKIAVMLARSGARSFLLIDDDILTPENLVRNELDWASMGEHKVDAVARRIALVAPGATCDLRRQRLGGQESNGVNDWALTLLGSCDLIVDATADPSVFNLLSSVAEAAKRTVIWAEVFGGGIGGLVCRSRPGFDPAPQTVRARVHAWCVEKKEPAPALGPRYEDSANGTPLIADDADVTVIAAHAARLCVDALVGRGPSWFPVSAYFIGLAKGWIFDQPFQTFPIDVGGPDVAEQADVVPDPAHIEALAQLISNGADETASAP